MQYEITLDDSQKQAKAALQLLKTIEGVSIRRITEPHKKAVSSKKAAKKTFLQNFREGLNDVRRIQEGTLQAKPLSELLNGD